MQIYKIFADESKKTVIVRGTAEECANAVGVGKSSISKMVKKPVKGMVAEKTDEIEGNDAFERAMFCFSCSSRTYNMEKHAITECSGKYVHKDKTLKALHKVFEIYRSTKKW